MSRIHTIHRRVSVEDGQLLVCLGVVIGFCGGLFACYALGWG